ncbi:ZIP family metal transporter [Candidatus Micrarchaeota archaeon]|nr:ZIP family metal transporter [Candidatus Micrarchaeota archaeon]
MSVESELPLLIFIMFAGQTLGCILGLIKKPSQRMLYASLAFSGAVMLGISFFQLIPESLNEAPFLHVAAAFVAGIVMMAILDRILPHVNPELLKKETPSVKKSIIMLLVGISLHNIPEGLAVGAGFVLLPSLGLSVALGIAIHDIVENIATVVPLYNYNKNRLKSFVIAMSTILFELVGFAIGYLFLQGVDREVVGLLLAIAAGFMTYLSLDELIPAARLDIYKKEGMISIALGLICMLVLAFILPH